jgi:TRAP-type C4-dicarboxylate transport system substrate-binding protein
VKLLRPLLALGLLAPAALAQPLAGTSAPAARTLSIATLAPIGSTWMRAFDAWNRDLRRRTHGALSLRFYPNGVQGDEVEVVRKIRARRLDGAALTGVGLAEIHRPTLVFQAPGLFADYAQLDHARDALRPDLDAAYTQAGFVLAGWGDAGLDRVFSTRAVPGPAEFASTHPFQWRDDLVAEPLYAELHARGVPLQIGEVLTSLQTRQIDTVIASPIAVASLQWAAHLGHMTDLPVAIEIGAVVFGRPQVEGLGPELQAALRETAAQYSALLVRNVRRDDDGTIAPLRARGMVVDTPTAAQRAQWQSVFTRTRARLVGTIADAAYFQRVERAR